MPRRSCCNGCGGNSPTPRNRWPPSEEHSMSEPSSMDLRAGGASAAAEAHPGAVVRAARQARGQTLQHLSILLKISERRLQAFEDERWDDVGDRTFVRALAQSLCRHLGLDPQPVLQSLPVPVAEWHRPADQGRLSAAAMASTPSIRRPVRMRDGTGISAWFTPVRAGVGVILAGALVLALMPPDAWPPSFDAAPNAGVAEPAAAPALMASEPVAAPVEPTVVAPEGAGPAPAAAAPAAVTVGAASLAGATPAPAPAPAPGAEASASPLQVIARQDTWVQVTDAKGSVILSRLLRSGERLGLEGARPLRLRVGNAAGTEATWLGRRVALDELQRNNVADVELP
ncbi:MAG: helix-turn-helix domain-containing protein [Betaproteobacteria bacterium]|nr:helix-turn-helix domain-containing protein [Betaproteobacteria bacterium]NBU50191.1 helix-turn-helix domain-containing protein [Betaproteobacteria bacterium]